MRCKIGYNVEDEFSFVVSRVRSWDILSAVFCLESSALEFPSGFVERFFLCKLGRCGGLLSRSF